jgi:hypothetical protein
VKMISEQGNQPDASVLAATHALLTDIEKWKAMRLKERVENAEQNSRRDVWNAFRAALRSPNDREAILSIMRLTTKTGVHAITLRPLSPYQMQPRNLDRAGPPCDRIRFTTS